MAMTRPDLAGSKSTLLVTPTGLLSLLLMMLMGIITPSHVIHGVSAASDSNSYGGVRLAKLDRKMTKLMRSDKVVGAAVAMWTVREEETLFRSYGFADKSNGREVDENTVFMAASVSKAVIGKNESRLVTTNTLEILSRQF